MMILTAESQAEQYFRKNHPKADNNTGLPLHGGNKLQRPGRSAMKRTHCEGLHSPANQTYDIASLNYDDAAKDMAEEISGRGVKVLRSSAAAFRQENAGAPGRW